MILSEKIMLLRKQNGWSQEELAAQLDVSRQSVSKWELGTSIPELDKILKLSELFDVSTDFLLKDDIEELPTAGETPAPASAEPAFAKSVSLEEANDYMSTAERVSKRIALGVSLCILSPVCLLLLGGMCEFHIWNIDENRAGGIGLCVLLSMVAVAVALLIVHSMPLNRFEYLQKEDFSLQYGVEGIVRKKMEAYAKTFRFHITLGTVLCIVSVVPLFLMIALGYEDTFFMICSIAVLLGIVAIGVFFFVDAGTIHGSFQALLQEGDYTPDEKLANRRISAVAPAYWCIVVAIYLGVSLYFKNWETSWIIWPVAGILFVPLRVCCKLLFRSKTK